MRSDFFSFEGDKDTLVSSWTMKTEGTFLFRRFVPVMRQRKWQREVFVCVFSVNFILQTIILIWIQIRSVVTIVSWPMYVFAWLCWMIILVFLKTIDDLFVTCRNDPKKFYASDDIIVSLILQSATEFRRHVHVQPPIRKKTNNVVDGFQGKKWTMHQTSTSYHVNQRICV